MGPCSHYASWLKAHHHHLALQRLTAATHASFQLQAIANHKVRSHEPARLRIARKEGRRALTRLPPPCPPSLPHLLHLPPLARLAGLYLSVLTFVSPARRPFADTTKPRPTTPPRTPQTNSTISVSAALDPIAGSALPLNRTFANQSLVIRIVQRGTSGRRHCTASAATTTSGTRPSSASSPPRRSAMPTRTRPLPTVTAVRLQSLNSPARTQLT